MALLSVHNLTLSFGSAPLLEDVDLNIESGDRACLVGRNGAGKSSFLKILNGELSPDHGEIRTAKDTRIAYLQQNVPEDLNGNILDIIVALRIQSDMDDGNDWMADQKAEVLISQLELTPELEFSELSGGQKRRVLLAQALCLEPDLLLLDEPTNHLDIESIQWMEDFLIRNCKTFLFVTHDRAFLRRVANRIIDLDRGKLAHWPCDYDTFLKRKEALLHEEEVQNKFFDKKLAKEEVWIRQGIKARRTRNEGRVKALEKMRNERRERRSQSGEAKINLQTSERSGHKVIFSENMNFSYDTSELILKNVNVEITRGDKIGIIGPNGAGKSTMLKCFTGELSPTSGKVELGTKLEISYFDQHRTALNENATVIEIAGEGNDTVTINGHSRHVISYMQDFLFSPQRARSPVSVLSGGERNRLLLAKMFAQPSNLLIMDEPTNDLDTETLELLEEQLLNYSGTVLMVSHDRAFLNNVVSNLLIMKSDATVESFIGSYDEWQDDLKKRQKHEIKQKKEN